MRYKVLPFMPTLMIFILLWMGGMGLAITGGLVQTDDAWFLQVAQRLLDGDVLYRQVYFGITPLSMYATAALARLLGAEIVVLRAVMALCFAATCLLTYQVARQLDLGRFGPSLMVLFLFAYLPVDLRYGVPYTSMASMFFLATFFATLLWRSSLVGALRGERPKPAWGLIVVAGVCAGLGFASKQNIGIFSLAALMVAIVVVHFEVKWSKRELIRVLLTASGAFVLAVSISLLPVLLSDSLGRFLEYSFFGQGSYLEVGRIPYIWRLERLYNLLLSPASFQDIYGIYLEALYLVPFLTFGALIFALLSGDPKNRYLAILVAVYAIAATAEIYPNAARSHILNALPALIIGLVFALRHTRLAASARFASILRVGLGLWAVVGILALVVFPIRWVASGNYVFSHLPHFRAVLLESSFLEETEANASKLVRAAGDKSTYLFIQEAGYYYLVTGLKNPTPYDLPLRPALGLNGESEIIAAIEGNVIEIVCMQPFGNHPRKPQQLENYVIDHMSQIRKLGLWTLYER